MKPIDVLLRKYKINVAEFELAKVDYYTHCKTINNPNFSVEKARIAFDNICNKFDILLRICADEIKLKESAGIVAGERKDVIPRVGFYTDTTDIGITLGLFRDFYLATEIVCPHNLKFMKDDFWKLLFELSTIGKFGFKEKEKPDKSERTKYPHLFNKTGNFYKLLRNYFLYETGTLREYRPLQLGYIGVSWENKTNFTELIPKFCKTFKLMYELNFMLWKHDNKHVKL
jgi:hypothetical protein